MYKYRDSRSTDLPPHIFQMAAEAYSELQEHGTNQSIISSGESGAGKTENTKQVFFFLAQVAATNAATDAAAAISDQLIASNFVLEAFGNAKTVRNNNSSRFGKLVDVRFDASARLSGTSIRTYLLEKSRISAPNERERNYHFFFQVLEAETEQLPETSASLCCLMLCRRHLLFLTCRCSPTALAAAARLARDGADGAAARCGPSRVRFPQGRRRLSLRRGSCGRPSGVHCHVRGNE